MQNAVPTGAQTSTGLTSDEAKKRLLEHGSNVVEEPKSHPVLGFLGKLWAPVPWMLEATILLGLMLKKHAEALVIGGLLLFNEALGFFQQRKAEQALGMLSVFPREQWPSDAPHKVGMDRDSAWLVLAYLFGVDFLKMLIFHYFDLH